MHLFLSTKYTQRTTLTPFNATKHLHLISHMKYISRTFWSIQMLYFFDQMILTSRTKHSKYLWSTSLLALVNPHFGQSQVFWNIQNQSNGLPEAKEIIAIDFT